MLLIDRINVSVINYLLFLIMNYVVMMMIIIMTLCINTAIYCAVGSSYYLRLEEVIAG